MNLDDSASVCSNISRLGDLAAGKCSVVEGDADHVPVKCRSAVLCHACGMMHGTAGVGVHTFFTHGLQDTKHRLES